MPLESSLSDPQLSSNSLLPFQKRKHSTSQSNPTPINEEAPILAPLPATPHVAAIPTPGKMVATGFPNPHAQVNTTIIPASPASLPNPPTLFVPVTPQTSMTKPAEGVSDVVPRNLLNTPQPTPSSQPNSKLF